jgi:hypothetical protein
MADIVDRYILETEGERNLQNLRALIAEVNRTTVHGSQEQRDALRPLLELQERYNRELREAANAADAAGRSTRDLGHAGLTAGRAIQDFAQGGIGGVLNNIEGLASALGGGPGLAGALTAVGVAAFVLGPHLEGLWESFAEGNPILIGLKGRLKDVQDALGIMLDVRNPRVYADAIDGLKAKVEALRKEVEADPIDVIKIEMLKQAEESMERLVKGAAAWKAIMERKTPEEAAQLKTLSELLDKDSLEALKRERQRQLTQRGELEAYGDPQGGVKKAEEDLAAYKAQASGSTVDPRTGAVTYYGADPRVVQAMTEGLAKKRAAAMRAALKRIEDEVGEATTDPDAFRKLQQQVKEDTTGSFGKSTRAILGAAESAPVRAQAEAFVASAADDAERAKKALDKKRARLEKEQSQDDQTRVEVFNADEQAEKQAEAEADRQRKKAEAERRQAVSQAAAAYRDDLGAPAEKLITEGLYRGGEQGGMSAVRAAKQATQGAMVRGGVEPGLAREAAQQLVEEQKAKVIQAVVAGQAQGIGAYQTLLGLYRQLEAQVNQINGRQRLQTNQQTPNRGMNLTTLRRGRR